MLMFCNVHHITKTHVLQRVFEFFKIVYAVAEILRFVLKNNTHTHTHSPNYTYV